ncbi:hypothetical protein PVAP13_2KG543300 [Panicum virgatum]|nr:hypothetical protein PVAP13_2KG543300 [Panicum virgatum]
MAAGRYVLAQFVDVAARAKKSALRPTFLVMLVLYPVVIFFTLGVRISHLEAVSLVPSGSGGLTFDGVVFFRTCISFILYSLIHACLLAYMMVPQSAPGAPRMARAFSWFAPLTFWLCSFLYFYTYADMTRYGTHVSD